MKVYQSDSMWILGIDGGNFEGMSQEPQAVIGYSRPVPTKMWETPSEIREYPFKDDLWEYDFTFREFQLEEKKIYILEVDYRRYKPGYISGRCEFLVSEEFVKEKIESLRQRNSLAEYKWYPNIGAWSLVEKLFKDEYDFDDEIDDEDDLTLNEQESESTIEKYSMFYLREKPKQDDTD
jgi:hypothetical protein